MLNIAVAAISKAVEKPMVEFPYRSRVLKITHRSRSAVPAARKEVGNQFYRGNSTASPPEYLIDRAPQTLLESKLKVVSAYRNLIGLL